MWEEPTCTVTPTHTGPEKTSRMNLQAVQMGPSLHRSQEHQMVLEEGFHMRPLEAPEVLVVHEDPAAPRESMMDLLEGKAGVGGEDPAAVHSLSEPRHHCQSPRILNPPGYKQPECSPLHSLHFKKYSFTTTGWCSTDSCSFHLSIIYYFLMF